MPSQATAAAASTSLPLDGVKVLDLCEGTLAYCGRLLCDLGAEVIKIEGPDGEPGRRMAPLAGQDGSISLPFLFLNAGKRSATVRFEESLASNRIDSLLNKCDVVLDDVDPGTPRSGLRDEMHRRLADRPVVWTSLTAHGRTGPLAGRPASDLTALAHGGLLSLAGAPGRAPLAPWGDQAWLATASFGALATLGALFRRHLRGVGAVIDVSAVEAVAHSLENAAQYFDLERVVRRRTGHKTEAATGIFPCRDGWVYLFTFMGGTLFGWDKLVEWLEAAGVSNASELRSEKWRRPEWRSTPAAYEALEPIFAEFASTRFRQELFEEGQRRGVIIGAVHTPTSLIQDPALCGRGFFRPLAVPGLGEISFPGAPYRFSVCDVHPRGPAPEVGEYRLQESL